MNQNNDEFHLSIRNTQRKIGDVRELFRNLTQNELDCLEKEKKAIEQRNDFIRSHSVNVSRVNLSSLSKQDSFENDLLERFRSQTNYADLQQQDSYNDNFYEQKKSRKNKKFMLKLKAQKPLSFVQNKVKKIFHQDGFRIVPNKYSNTDFSNRRYNENFKTFLEKDSQSNSSSNKENKFKPHLPSIFQSKNKQNSTSNNFKISNILSKTKLFS